MADIAVINKVNTAGITQVEQVRRNIERNAPDAVVILADSKVIVNEPQRIRGKEVLVVEDGPTLTHGEMPYGAGKIAAQTFKAAGIIDPRKYATGTLRETFRRYPHIDAVLPAMGYSKEQIQELERTINAAPCDLVLFATPIHLTRLLSINKPTIRVRYEYQDRGEPLLENELIRRLNRAFEVR